jgi:hypothetical protein
MTASRRFERLRATDHVIVTPMAEPPHRLLALDRLHRALGAHQKGEKKGFNRAKISKSFY